MVVPDSPIGKGTPMTNYARYPSLEDTPVVISGGASGIGATLVREFAAQGARVGFVDIATEAGEALVAELTEAGHTVAFTRCDVTRIEDYRSAIEGFAARHGDALVLVNNAAHDQRHEFEDVTSEYFDERIAVNLKHQFFAAQAVTPGMREKGGGSIVNFGSFSWRVGFSGMPVYTTAKAAIEGLTRSLAREFGRDGIRVNAIIPGNVQTPRQMKWYTPEGEAEIVAQQCLEGRIQPSDIAAMALFLASDDARFCTAHNYWVDAGWR